MRYGSRFLWDLDRKWLEKKPLPPEDIVIVAGTAAGTSDGIVSIASAALPLNFSVPAANILYVPYRHCSLFVCPPLINSGDLVNVQDVNHLTYKIVKAFLSSGQPPTQASLVGYQPSESLLLLRLVDKATQAPVLPAFWPLTINCQLTSSHDDPQPTVAGTITVPGIRADLWGACTVTVKPQSGYFSVSLGHIPVTPGRPTVLPVELTSRPPRGIYETTPMFLLPAAVAGLEVSQSTPTVTWTEVPGGGQTPSSPAVAAAPTGDVHLIVQGTDNHIWLNIQRNGTWLGWASHPSGLTGSSPAAAVDSIGNLQAFVRGVDDRIYQSSYSGASWNEWAEVPGGGLTTSGPEATVNPVTGELTLVVRGTDNQIYLNTQTGAAWSGWSPVPVGGLTPSKLGVAYDSSGILWLLARGIEDGIWVTSKSGGNWSNWMSIGGSTYAGLTAVASGNIVSVFVQGVDDHIYQNSHSNGQWSGWSEVSGGGLTPDAPKAVVDAHGNVLLFVRGM